MGEVILPESPCARPIKGEPDKPRLLDLFSGIGGFSLGLERAGFRTVAFCEVNPKCRHLLAHHWPEVPCYDDIRTLTAERLAADGIAVDAICGGFPCQDISFAGLGAGIEGERSGLWRDYARLIGELRPRVVIVENVAALLGRGLGVVLGDLASLGYDAWWDCIPASAVGAPHRRDRLWLVAYARGQQHEGYGDALRRAIAAELLTPDANGGREHDGPLNAEVGGASPALADPARLQPRRKKQRPERERVGAGGELVALSDASRHGRDQGLANAGGRGCGGGAEQGPRPWGGCWWQSEPNVGRVAHGVPARVDRLHGLGNAVVPAIPEILGRAVLAAIQAEREAA